MNKNKIIKAIKFMKEYQTENDIIEAKISDIDISKKCYDTISTFAKILHYKNVGMLKCSYIRIGNLDENMIDYKIYSL